MSGKSKTAADPQYDEHGNLIETVPEPELEPEPADETTIRLTAVEAVLNWAWPGELEKVTAKLAAETKE
jgi:hypothetical protein